MTLQSLKYRNYLDFTITFLEWFKLLDDGKSLAVEESRKEEIIEFISIRDTDGKPLGDIGFEVFGGQSANPENK